MASFDWPLFIPAFVFFTVMWWLLLFSKHSPLHRRSIQRPDYDKIASMEEEIYGHQWDGDTPLPTPRATRIINAQAKARELAAQEQQLLRNQWRWNSSTGSPLPTFPGDPLWTDDDGRPW